MSLLSGNFIILISSPAIFALTRKGCVLSEKVASIWFDPIRPRTHGEHINHLTVDVGFLDF
jgi:hypothetical protein